jgi:hypothetical protein
VDVGTQGLRRDSLPRHRASQLQQVGAGAGTECDAVCDICGLQRPSRVCLLTVNSLLGEVSRDHVLHQRSPPRCKLHQTHDDRPQQRVHRDGGGRTDFDEQRHAIGAALVGTVQNQAVKVHVGEAAEPKRCISVAAPL